MLYSFHKCCPHCLNKMAGIQTNTLFDLINRCMGQAGILHSAMDKSSIPTVLLQFIFQVLANATCSHTLFSKQNNFIISQFCDKFFCKGIYLYKFQHVTSNIFAAQHPGSLQYVSNFICITHKDD